MQCSVCKEEIKDGLAKCGHCGASIESTAQEKKVAELQPGNKKIGIVQQPWWKYSVFSDKSIARVDQILFFVYIGFAFYIPISAVLWLLAIHIIRKNSVNDVYRKSATVVVIGVSVFSLVANFIRQFNH